MESNNSMRQITQDVLDSSYKIYSDVSLINSSLFRAAYALGVELPEIPQISLAATKESSAATTLNKASSAMEKLSTGKKIPLFGISKTKIPEEGDNEINAHKPNVSENKELKTTGSSEEKIQKMEREMPSAIKYKPQEIEGEVRESVAAVSHQNETKISLDEKESKLNKIQNSMPTKISITGNLEGGDSQISPLEATSPVAEKSPQSELQKSIFETTNFGKLNTAQKGEEVNEIINNPINKLLALVKEKHNLTISEAAQALNVDKELINKWARILSQSSLIRIKYQFVGDSILEA